MSKHELFKTAHALGGGDDAEDERRRLFKAYAEANDTTYKVLLREYDEWVESLSAMYDGTPSLADCSAARDFMPARYALAMGGRDFNLYSVEDVNRVQVEVGLLLDPEDDRRAANYASQADAWREIGSSHLGGYEITHDAQGCITAARYMKEGTAAPTLIARDVILRGRAQNYHGEAWQFVVEYRDQSSRWKTDLIAAGAISNRSDEWARLLKAKGAIIIDAVLLAQIFQMSSSLKIIRIAEKPGWQDDEFRVYTSLTGETFGHSSETMSLFESPKGYGVKKGSKEEADRELIGKAVGNSRLIGTVCGMLAGPFLAPFGVHPGVIHYYGASSDGKSVSQKVGQSVVGLGHRILSWNTTENGIEGLATQHNGAGMMIEELKQGASPKAVYKGIMALGNGTGKHAMTRQRTLKPAAEFQVLCISSGEANIRDFLSEARVPGVTYDAGVASRSADIPSDAGAGMGCFEELHGAATPYEFAKGLEKASSMFYGHHFPALMQAYLEAPELNRRKIQTYMTEAYSALGLSGDENVSRVGERFSLIAAVGEFAIEKSILTWPRGEAMRGILQLAGAWREARRGEANLTAGSTEALIGVQLLEKALAQDMARFSRPGLQLRDRCLGFLSESEDAETVLYMSKSQLIDVVGAERVTPMLRYISDDKITRFKLKTANHGLQVPTPKKGGIRASLGNWCYAIILREIAPDEIGADI